MLFQMRSKSRMVVVALVAVFAIGAVASSSALASPEWYAKKGGVWTKVITPVNVKATWTFELSDNAYPELGEGPLTISWEAETLGVVGAGAAGVINQWSTASAKCKNVCEVVKSATPEDLAWSTALYKEGSEIRERISEDAHGIPQLRFQFLYFFGQQAEETCHLNTNTKMTNNATGVEGTFDKKSNTKCRAEGEFKGTIKIAPTASEKAAGVE